MKKERKWVFKCETVGFVPKQYFIPTWVNSRCF